MVPITTETEEPEMLDPFRTRTLRPVTYRTAGGAELTDNVEDPQTVVRLSPGAVILAVGEPFEWTPPVAPPKPWNPQALH